MVKGALEDKFAFEEIQKLVEKFNIKRIIETGTYLGWSSKKLSDLNISVDTIEINESNYQQASNFLSDRQNVKVHLGSSVELLPTILSNSEENLLIFLDAHWYEYWPILDELKIIASKKIKPVISIHDFYVPDGNGNAKFGFDMYKNQNLDFDFIKNSVEEIYGQNYSYHYNDQIESVDRGLIFIYPEEHK